MRPRARGAPPRRAGAAAASLRAGPTAGGGAPRLRATHGRLRCARRRPAFMPPALGASALACRGALEARGVACNARRIGAHAADVRAP